MKKISFLALALGAALCAMAQANTIKDAERAMKNGDDYDKVAALVKPLLAENPGEANFIAASAAYKEYDKMIGLKSFGKLKTNADTVKMDRLLLPAYEHITVALKNDTVVDAKGKVKTKNSKDIINLLAGHYKDYLDAGVELYNHRDYKGAYDAWADYVAMHDIAPLTERLAKMGVLQPDSVVGEIAFNQALAAWQGDNFEDAISAFLKAREKGFKSKKIYDFGIAVSQAAQKPDTLLFFAKQGLELYGTEDPQYIAMIVNYYLQKEDYDEAFNYVNRAIEMEPENSQYYVIQGVLFDRIDKKDEAKAAFLKATELDPNNGQALYNYGRSLCEEAFALNDAAPATQAEYEEYYNNTIKPVFEQAVEVLEKAYAADPDNRDVLLYLENAYYNLKDEKMYNDVQKRKAY